MSELFELLAAEVSAANDDFSASLSVFLSAEASPDESSDAFESCVDALSRISVGAEMVEMQGVIWICGFVIENLQYIDMHRASLSDTQRRTLEVWPVLLIDYFNSDGQAAAAEKLIEHFKSDQWPSMASQSDIALLSESLEQSASLGVEDVLDDDPRQETATAEDVSLELPDDLNQQIYNSFLEDAPAQAREISLHIQAFIREPDNIEYVISAQRIVHTLKGAAATVGVNGIFNLAHHYEDILELLANRKCNLNEALAEILIDTADCLEQMVEALIGMAVPPEQAMGVLQNILDWANKPDSGSLAVVDEEQTISITGLEHGDAAPVSSKFTTESVSAPAAPSADNHASQSVRISADQLDHLLKLIGELAVASENMREKLQTIIYDTQARNNQDNVIQTQIFDLENLVDIQGVNLVRRRSQADRQTEDLFDPLEMDQYSDLHSYTRSIAEATTDAKEFGMQLVNDLAALESMIKEHTKINRELRDDIAAVRMLPVNSIVPRLERNMRQVSRDTNKKVQLEVLGGEVLVDTDILNRVVNLLMHILRNAIDHGIESQEERSQKGKPAVGQLKVAFKREGGNIVVQFKDDGRGLDYEAILASATERGLIDENATIDQSELKRLILLPGFSSRESVSAISGRGVGMDVVNQTILEMRGSMSLDSVPGQGLSVTLRLPITVISMYVSLVKTMDRVFAIPSSMVLRVISSEKWEVVKLAKETAYKIDDKVYPVKTLAQILGINEHDDDSDIDISKPALLIQSDTEEYAVFVDEILGNRESVIRNFGDYVGEIHGLMGGIALADGSIVSVLDMATLLRAPVSSPAIRDASLAIQSQASLPKVLVVEDSVSARRSLAELLSDAGYMVMTATDGLQAIDAINDSTPDVILTDLEMPRMNGLELATHIRASNDTNALPIIMITSRYADKHREQANRAGVNDYLTKPYIETEVLDKVSNLLRA